MTVAASDTPAVGTRPALAFHDADGAKRWVKTLPLMPVGQAYEALRGQQQALLAADVPPRERATLAEILREPVMHLHTELARRFAGKPQPAGERESDAFEHALTLWQGLWEQYSLCLKPLLEGDPELQGVKAKLLQRGLYVGKQMMLLHGLARRVPPGSLWQELHAYYRIAEMLECGVQAVSDDLVPDAVGLSCYSTYSHALLLGLADPCALTVRQIEVADRWLQHWARKVFPYAQQRETEGPVIEIDLEGGGGGRLVQVPPRDAPASMRFGYPAKLATSVRGRLKRLAAGASPAELQLGHDVTIEQCITLLAWLDAHWYQVPRRSGENRRTTIELCAGGLPAAYFRVGGRTFEKQEPQGRLTYSSSQHLATLSALTDYDRYREEAEKTYRWERWTGEADWKEATVQCDARPHHRWFLDQLVTIRDDEQRLRLGVITRVALAPDGTLSLGLKLWPGSPRAITLRPVSSAFSEDPPLPAIELGETPEERPQLLLPQRTFTPSRPLRTTDSGPERRLRLTRLLQRGGDFERVAFDPETD